MLSLEEHPTRLLELLLGLPALFLLRGLASSFFPSTLTIPDSLFS